MTGSPQDEWHRIAAVPVDTGRLVLVDPMNLGDAVDYEDHVLNHAEDDDAVWSANYQLVTNQHGVAVALVFSTGLGDGLYPFEARFEEVEGAVRIAEVRIRFLPHPSIGYRLPWEESVP